MIIAVVKNIVAHNVFLGEPSGNQIQNKCFTSLLRKPRNVSRETNAAAKQLLESSILLVKIVSSASTETGQKRRNICCGRKMYVSEKSTETVFVSRAISFESCTNISD